MSTTPVIANQAIKSSRLVSKTPFFYGWVILAVGVVGLIMGSLGQTFVISVFIDHFINDLVLSRSSISLIYGVGTFAASFLLPKLGRLLDQYGSRAMILFVAFGLGLVGMGMSLVNGIVLLFAGFVLLRLFGLGGFNMVCLNIISQWFIRRRGFVMGLTGLGLSFGFAFSPVVSQRLIDLLGWRLAWVILGLLVWVVMLPIGWFLFKNKPEEYGLWPDGEADIPLIDDKSGQPNRSSRPLEENWTLAEARQTGAFWLFIANATVLSMIFSGLTFHQLSIFAERGMALNAALQGFQVAALVSAISVFVVGWLLDRVSIRLILAVTMTVEIGILLMLQVMAEPWHILPYGLLFGMSGGSFMAMDAVVWPKYFGRAHLGSIRGVTTTAMVVGAALGPFPMGLGLDYLGSYGPVLTAFTIFPLAIAVAAFFVQRPERKGQ